MRISNDDLSFGCERSGRRSQIWQAVVKQEEKKRFGILYPSPDHNFKAMLLIFLMCTSINPEAVCVCGDTGDNAMPNLANAVRILVDC